MPNKITVYARPLFRLVCRPNEIMTIGSAWLACKLNYARTDTDTDIFTATGTDAVADTAAWDDADTDTLA